MGLIIFFIGIILMKQVFIIPKRLAVVGVVLRKGITVRLRLCTEERWVIYTYYIKKKVAEIISYASSLTSFLGLYLAYCNLNIFEKS